MGKEHTLVLIKPCAIRRSIVGQVLAKLEESKLKLIATRLKKVSNELAMEHYAQHKDKPFFPQLMDYITGKLHHAPVLALVYSGEGAIKKIRDLVGDTNPEKAQPDTVRGMFGRVTTSGLIENVVHASANSLEAEREIKLWFEPDDIIQDVYPVKIVDGKRVWEHIPKAEDLIKSEGSDP